MPSIPSHRPSIALRRGLLVVDGVALSLTQIRQFRALLKRHGDLDARADDCWIWQGDRSKGGHGIFHVEYKDGRTVKLWAHRVAYMLSTLIQLPDGLVVRHKCGLACCCNPAHLVEGSHRDNRQDYILHTGLERRLSDADRATIQTSRASIRAMAKRFDIAPGSAWKIRYGKPSARRCRGKSAGRAAGKLTSAA